MYEVLDNGYPANYKGYPFLEGKGWDVSEFETLNEAREYLKHWLGVYCPNNVHKIQADEKVFYNGMGDWVEIRTVPYNDV